MHKYEILVLAFLKKRGSADLRAIEGGTKLQRDSVSWAIETLAKEGAVEVSRSAEREGALTDEGRQYTEAFPEETLLRELAGSGGKAPAKGKSNIALVWAKRNGWIAIDKGAISITAAGKKFLAGGEPYAQRELLGELAKGGDLSAADAKSGDTLRALELRGLITIKERQQVSSVKITQKGLELGDANAGEAGAADLTREMLSKGSWRDVSFRKYDVGAAVEPFYPARQHPVKEFLNYLRDMWVSMGFIETVGPVVESSFWNFDALFSPQDHPTRDMQDTYFISNPKTIDIEDVSLLDRVKKMHTRAWKESWREEIAKQPLLRTHTTSVSVRNIQRLANAVQDQPLRLFSIGKVFRNESIDYNHLAELHQMDGIIIGKKLGIANLIYTLREFFSNIGLETDRKSFIVKPSYFPFVEPGIEIYYVDKGTGASMELVGAGIIRKEIAKAMGTDKTILAWGIGIDRLMFNFMKLGSLSELYDNNVGWLRRRERLRI